MVRDSKYIHLYETKQAHDADHAHNSANYIEPWVAYTVETEEVTYNLPDDYSRDYLTFEALEDGTFTFTMEYGLTTDCVESVSYSLDDGQTWVTTNNIDNQVVTVTTPTVERGGKVLWKGTAVQYSAFKNWINGKGYFTSTGTFSAAGNIMSMIYDDDFRGIVTLPTPVSTGISTGSFGSLFGSGNCGIVSASDLILPATTLTGGCYNSMFKDCTALTTAPELSATTLADYCYQYMFNGCTSLTTAPALPAITLATQCYFNMFGGCTSLTAAPELPAETLAQSCYDHMFYGCTSLTAAPELPAETLASECYRYMFAGCTALTTAPATLPATTLADYCYQYMFYGCTSLTTAPELPATTLADYCYQDMFYGCTALTTAPELPATTLADYCYQDMFYGCTALTTAPELPATTLARQCYYHMFENCTSLTSAPELPATTLANDCYSSMFNGCTSLTTAPALPATTLVSGCYVGMFSGCTRLAYIKAMFTAMPSTDTSSWVYGVAATGTFVKNSAAQWDVTGVDGVPDGWTVETAS